MAIKKKSIKQLLKDLESEELKEIILQLAKNDKKNDKFIRYFIQGSDSSDIKELAAEAEKELYKCFFLRQGFPRFPPNVAAARLILNQYTSVLRHSTNEIVSLNLSLVEYCIEHISFSDDQRIFQFLLNTFTGAYNELEKHPSYIKDFAERLKSIYNELDFLSEAVDEQYFDLEELSGITLTYDEQDQIIEEIEQPQIVKEEDPVKEEIPIFRLNLE